MFYLIWYGSLFCFILEIFLHSLCKRSFFLVYLVIINHKQNNVLWSLSLIILLKTSKFLWKRNVKFISLCRFSSESRSPLFPNKLNVIKSSLNPQNCWEGHNKRACIRWRPTLKLAHRIKQNGQEKFSVTAQCSNIIISNSEITIKWEATTKHEQYQRTNLMQMEVPKSHSEMISKRYQAETIVEKD